ncbi:polyprenyl diphosphate synthase [Parachlamydia sp. AcF125]|uniref:polyprenyl diphosphate synthase n=1 Tax=Parachlamydia sp. AcF125 TaxID=2795736 RepID=UPI001BCA2FE0|nr:polyprenyl diphosphate synthase [Parachlamydia sp. AcF125]MBS4167427.1 Ditrans,polycis-undecaprenyl-diphosphate synthase ((2E,6E)-farnesyl-diphosphate specific) [Parachlamydia sp. AcF125]
MLSSTTICSPPTESIYQAKDLIGYDRSIAPRHVAIIPDGNRRWAKKQQASAKVGHREGADNLIEIVKACKELGIQAVTFYAFSTENWARPQEEVQALMWLLDVYLTEQRGTMLKEGIRFDTIGDLSKIPENVVETITKTKQFTKQCDQVRMILAVNYGGRDDICRAVNRLVKDYQKQEGVAEKITEEVIARYLDTANMEDPDLLIRTSGEWRISNFLLWQISYTEVYITDVLWPDFTPFHLLEALYDFQKRKRRLGG